MAELQSKSLTQEKEAADAGDPPTPGAESLKGNVWYCMNKAAQVLRIAVEEAILPFGLRRRHYAALSVLLEGEMSQQGLSERIPIDRATMVAVIDDLERLGYAERRPRPDDRRAYLVALRPEGEVAFREATAKMGEAEAAKLADLSAAERRLLADLSKKILKWRRLSAIEIGLDETLTGN